MAGFLPVCHRVLLQMHHSHKFPAGFHLLLLYGSGFQGHPEGNSSSCHFPHTVQYFHPKNKSGYWYLLSFPAGYGSQVDQIADSFRWFQIVSFLLSYPVSQPVIEIVGFCSASIHSLFQTVDGSIDILVLYLSIF